jgi:hypothetical protein
MFTILTRYGVGALLVLWATTVSAQPPALNSTGWMGFRNQTGMTLILQETYANGRQGAAQKLFANETLRDTPTANGQRKFTIFNAKEPDKPIYTGSFACPVNRESVLYILKSDGKNGLLIEGQRLSAGPIIPTKRP